MKDAGRQQKAWVNQRCSESVDMLETFAFLSYFPAGIPDEINPIFHKIEALKEREPLMNYLLESSHGLTRIDQISLISELQELYPQAFESIKSQCLELGEQFLNPHELLELQLRIVGQPSEECLESLLTEYESTRSLNLLLELCDAMSDIQWGNAKLNSRLSWNLKILDLLLNYDAYKALDLIKSLPTEHAGQWTLLLEVLWQFGAENLWLEYLEQVETLDVFGSLVVQILLRKCIKEDMSATQIEDMFTDQKLMELENLLSLLHFMEGKNKPHNWDQVLKALPEMAHYAEAVFQLHNNGLDESLRHINLAIGSSLKNGNLSYLPQLLTLLSEYYGNHEDFDHQLFFYREAVIAQQFLSNGA